MKKLNIKKGDFLKYLKTYSNNNLKVIEENFNKITFNDTYFLERHNLKNHLKDHLKDIYNLDDNFFEGSFNNLKEKILLLINKYNLSSFLDELQEITINEDITIDNRNDNFINNFIFNSKIKIIFKGDVRITSLANIEEINNLVFEKGILIGRLDCKEIKFIKCIFKRKNYKGFIFEPNNFNYFSFEECEIGSFVFENKKIIENPSYPNRKLEIVINKCSGKIKIENSEIGNLKIIDSNFEELIIKNNIFSERVKISSVFGNKKDSKNTKILFGSNKINNLRIGHQIIDRLEIYNIKNPTDSEINLGNLEVNNFLISNLRNLGKIRIYDLNNKVNNDKKEIINLNNSSFGDSEFQNINMKSFKENKIYDNLFSDLKYTGVVWKYDIIIGNEKDFGRLRDSYRILKNVASNNDDSIVSNKFFAKEMDSYKKMIDNRIGINKNTLNSIKNDGFFGEKTKLIGDKIILFLGKQISEFGNNWIRPLFLIIILAFLFTDFIYLYDNFYKTTKGIENFKLITNYSYLDFLRIIKNFLWIIDFYLILVLFTKKYFLTSIILLGLFIQFVIGYNILDIFAKLLYPLYGLKKDFIDSLNFLQLMGLIIYKSIYGILAYHFIIAIKRTTKR